MKKNQNPKRQIAGLAFTGCMFVGMGVGWLYNNFLPFMFIGMGVGMAFMAIINLAASEEEKWDKDEHDA